MRALGDTKKRRKSSLQPEKKIGEDKKRKLTINAI